MLSRQGWTRGVLLLLLATLAACGGGGGGNAAPAPSLKAWGTAALIETASGGNAESPQVAFDASGNALAVWSKSDGTRYNIWVNRYTAGTGWGTAQLIEANAGDAWLAEVAIDTSGHALAVWCQSDGTRYNLWANRFQ